MVSTGNSLSRGAVEGRKRSLISITLLSLVIALGPWQETEAGDHISQNTTSSNQAVAERQQTTELPRQIMLDARVVVMKRHDVRKLGVWREVALRDDESSTGTSRGNRTNTKATSVQMLHMPDHTATDALLATLRDLENDGRLRGVCNPQLIVEDGAEALLRFIRKEWFLISAVRSPHDFYWVHGADVAIEPGLAVSVTPHLGDGNDVAVEIAFEVSDRMGRERDATHAGVLRRTQKHSTTLQFGGTVVLTGLASYGREIGRSSGLARLPLVGGLFRNNKTAGPAKNTVIFVTPHLIPEPPRR